MCDEMNALVKRYAGAASIGLNSQAVEALDAPALTSVLEQRVQFVECSALLVAKQLKQTGHIPAALVFGKSTRNLSTLICS